MPSRNTKRCTAKNRPPSTTSPASTSRRTGTNQRMEDKVFNNVSRVFNVSRIKEATKWLKDDSEEYTQWVYGPDESGRVVVSVTKSGFIFKVEKIPGPVFRLQG